MIGCLLVAASTGRSCCHGLYVGVFFARYGVLAGYEGDRICCFCSYSWRRRWGVAHWCSGFCKPGLEHGLRALQSAFILVKMIYMPVRSDCAYVSTGTQLRAFWAVRAIALSMPDFLAWQEFWADSVINFHA